MKLDIQMFADRPKLVIDTELNSKNFENGLNRLQSTTQKAGNTIKSIVAGLGISKAISMAISTINNSIDSSIDRLDTLRNFPKVMSNLGIAGDKADKSIKKMSDELAGLPTTLNEGALAVQRFTSANSDVEKSTDMFLAFNNALLAGGASTEVQANALNQLSEAYARGKPELKEWNSWMIAMPGQLKQVATAMGYVSTDELGTALREGAVSMDEFMEAVVQLNEEGIDGFENFKTQARNSVDGIKTSITVAKTQVVKGVADIIDALDIKFEQLGFGKISDIIANFGKDAKKGLDSVAELIKGDTKKIILDGLKDLETSGPQMIENFTKGLTDKIPSVINTAGDILTQFINTLNANLPQIINSGAEIISTLITGLAEQMPELIPQVVNIILTIASSLLDNVDKIVDAGIKLIMGLADGIVNAIPILIDRAPEIIDKLVNALVENLPKLMSVGPVLLRKLGEGIIRNIPSLLSVVPSVINSIVSGFLGYAGKMADIGANMIKGIWKGLKDSAMSWLKSKVTGLAGQIVSFFTGAFKIGSPSKVMRDQVGKWLPLGMYEGFEDELDGVYRDMQKAINFENAKLQANVETGKVFNTLANTTPVYIQVDGDVEMDNTKVGRLITPVVSETLKTGGLR